MTMLLHLPRSAHLLSRPRSVTCIMIWFSPRWQLSSSAPRHMKVPCGVGCRGCGWVGVCEWDGEGKVRDGVRGHPPSTDR